jgi:hypothetical protein
MANRAVDMSRRSYKEFLKAYENMDSKAFRAYYTAQRDVVHKQLVRLSKSSGEKANIAKELLTGKGKIMKLSELDKMVKEQGLNKAQAAKLYASALSNINTIYHSPRSSIKGWQQITKKIQKTLEKNGYGEISKKQLDLMGEIMARVYAIYGRKYAPSDEVMEAVAEGLGPKMAKMSNADLQNLLKNWKSRDNLETS